MSKRLTSFIIVVFCMLVAIPVSGKKFTLVIDAGHGGHDAGAMGSFSKEKDINLRTALAFGRYVEANCPDVNVIYTRKNDVFVTLHGRADIANKAKADLFMSIHTNSLPAGHIARGLETYTLGMHRAADNLDVAKRENSVILVEKDYQQHYEGFDPNSSESYIIFEFMQDHNMEKSVELAKMVQKNVCSIASRPDKGVKQAGFLVLRETSMPSCLIELGFISTPDEEQLLNNATSIDNIARGIYNAFIAYKNKYDSNASVTYQRVSQNAVEQQSYSATSHERQPVATVTTVPAASVFTTPVTSNVVAEPASQEEVPKTELVVPKTEQVVKKENVQPVSSDAPVFKVQITTSDRVLSQNDSRLKGHSDAEYYKENNLVKYTLGSSTNYNEIYKLRKEILSDFPDAFIIAFKGGEKMNVNEAIREFKARR